MKFDTIRIQTRLTAASLALVGSLGGLLGALSAQGAEPAMRPATSAKDACKIIVEAAKKDDFETVRLYTTPTGRGEGERRKEAERRFHRMHRDQLAKLKDLSCGSEHRADAHAVVEAESEGRKRLVPFVEEKGGWKFDLRTYLSFYRQDMMKYAKRPLEPQGEKKEKAREKKSA